MSKINKLTINGTTYQLEDPSATRTLLVTVDADSSLASYNSRDIYTLAQQGCAFYLQIGESLIPLTFTMESEATFSRILYTGEKETYFIYDDGVYECVTAQHKNNPLVVEISETASHSATEILRYIGNDGYVIGMDDNGKLAAFAGYDLDSELTIFKTHTDANGAWKEYTIDDNKNVTVKEMSFATKGQIGDMETALDAIIAIQNELIGGDA